MGAPKKPRPADIRLLFDKLSDDVHLDDQQVASLANRSVSTVKRLRRAGKLPPPVWINGLPRHRAGLIRLWLRGEPSARRSYSSPPPKPVAIVNNETPAS